MSRSASHDDGFAHSIADLMAGVAVVFLLIAVVFILLSARREKSHDTERDQYQSRIRELESFRQRVLLRLDALRTAIETDTTLHGLVAVDRRASGDDPFLSVVVFDPHLVSFEPTKCALSAGRADALTGAAPQVLDRVCSFMEQNENTGIALSITLEGHTDGRPFRASDVGCGIDQPELSRGCTSEPLSQNCLEVGFENNVRLSAARAQSVFFALRRAAASDARLGRCLERYFVIAGRGPVEPTDGRAWREPRSPAEDERNRRVLLKIRAEPLLPRETTDAVRTAAR